MADYTPASVAAADGQLERKGLKGRIRDRLNAKPYADTGVDPKRLRHDATTIASGVTEDCKVRDRAIEAHQREPNKTFPTPLVVAALRAADVIMPEDLEQRVLTIARMYAQGATATKIAEVLGIDRGVAQSEIKKLDKGRQIAYAEDPSLAVKVVEEELNVLQLTQEMIRTDIAVLKMIEDELRMDHEDKLKAIEANNPYAYKRGINSLKADSYFKAREVIGKQADRLGELQGLLGKHAAQHNNVAGNQTTNIIQFGNAQLNEVADMFMKMTGNVPASATRTVAEVLTDEPDAPIDVEAT